MSERHPAFWYELSQKIGAPILAATIVGCILKAEVHWTHGVLGALGLGLVYWGHRVEHHRN